MKTTQTNPLNDVENPQGIIVKLIEENKKQASEIEYLNEWLNLLLAHIYGKKSEKNPSQNEIPGQLSFLDSDEDIPVVQPLESVDVPAHTRKTSGRKPLPDDLPRVEVIHDISEDQKQCACGSTLSRIGEERSEQLSYIPAKLEVIRNIRPKYACRSCEGVETEGSTIKIAPPPKQILPKSIASAGLLATITVAKFVDSLPFYRQEKQFTRLGYEISRANMANWTIQLGIILKKLHELLRHEILSGPLINMDETTLQVLKEKGRSPTTKSYMWVMRGGVPDNPGVYFHYSPSRSASVAVKLLSQYQGVVQTDGYVGYDFIDRSQKLEHAGCWVHARRKFNDVIKAKNKHQKKKAKSGHADNALNFIRQLYAIEHEADEKEFSETERTALREQKSTPILNQFLKWLQSVENQVPPRSLLGKAISYTLQRWDQLTLYPEHGYIRMDNNMAENAIRPYVVGRKNWLFCDTVPGAEAMAIFYSLIETAKTAKLNPVEYLKNLFEQLPYAEGEDQLRNLLPQYMKPVTPRLTREGVGK
ncbi:MAG: IS66 family transposase [Proteobacteria bacterium]|nr:IS66 family transposase [Pseudomonadota bacterium]